MATLDLALLTLGDFGMDAMDLEAEHVLDFNVLSLVDADDVSMTDDDVLKTLQDCLFGSQLVLSAPHITVMEPTKPPAPVVAKRALYQPSKRESKQPPAKRRRNRKRTEQQRDSENKIRTAKMTQHYADRDACIKAEGKLRSRVRDEIVAFANAVGLPVDARILEYLPAALRFIMWQSDAAIGAYKKFTGWNKLCQTVNGLGEWW